MSETPATLTNDNRYVIQLEHRPTVGAEALQYLIKDYPLRQEFDALKARLLYYRGISNNGAGTLEDNWINEADEGIYIVTSVSGIIIDNYNLSDSVVNTLWENFPTSEENEIRASYINYNNNTISYSTSIALPAILIIGKNNQNNLVASLIDANSFIWRRNYDSENNNYYWINILDDKANIKDFRILAEKVYAQELAIAQLQEDLKNLASELEAVKAAQQVETILLEGVDPTHDSITNILIIGDNIAFNETYGTMPDLIQTYLNLKGTVVWIKNSTTQEALSYVQTYMIDGKEYPVTISKTLNNVTFSNNQVNGQEVTSLKIADFDIIIIIMNKNDINSTTTYGGINSGILGMIGEYISGNNITTTPAETPNITGTAPNYIIDPFQVTISHNTISAAIQKLVSQIRKLNTGATIQMATPITWQKDSNTTLTKTEEDNITQFQQKIVSLCTALNIEYNKTRQIDAEHKNKLTTNGVVNDEEAINQYKEDLCKLIKYEMPSTPMTFSVKPEERSIISKKSATLKGEIGETLRILTPDDKTYNANTVRGQKISMPTSGSGTFTLPYSLQRVLIKGSQGIIYPSFAEITIRLYKITTNNNTETKTLVDNCTATLNSAAITSGTFSTTWNSNDQFYIEVVTASQFNTDQSKIPTVAAGTHTAQVKYYWDYEATY